MFLVPFRVPRSRILVPFSLQTKRELFPWPGLDKKITISARPLANLHFLMPQLRLKCMHRQSRQSTGLLLLLFFFVEGTEVAGSALKVSHKHERENRALASIMTRNSDRLAKNIKKMFYEFIIMCNRVRSGNWGITHQNACMQIARNRANIIHLAAVASARGNLSIENECADTCGMLPLDQWHTSKLCGERSCKMTCRQYKSAIRQGAAHYNTCERWGDIWL